MISISLCMIVKNEEETVGSCLDSVKDIVDEIIVVDTGSQDRTKEILSRYSADIYDFEWINDFSAARNYSFSKATKDYILWLDADDVILEEDRQKLLRLKAMLDPSVDVVIMKYNLGSTPEGTPICSFPRERLLKRSMDLVWHDCVHEYLILKGKIINTDICVTHRKKHGKTPRNLMIFEEYLKAGNSLSDRNKFYYARELFLNERYEQAIEYYEAFLETSNGLTSNYIDACMDLSHCYRLQNQKKKELETLVRSFCYAAPRAEVCCKLGYYYKEQNELEKAVDWFLLATRLVLPKENTTSIMQDYWNFIPYMELSICSFKLENYPDAVKYNELAGAYKPNNPAYLKNKELLSKLNI